jgi:PAS domain S-box-containing protein
LYAASYIGFAVFGRVDQLAVLLLAPFALDAIALWGFRIFGPLPASRRTAIDQMREGVVICDAGWSIVSLNPAAAKILGLSERSARGRTIQELLPASWHATTASSGAGEALDVLTLETDGGVLHFATRLSSLYDHRGTTIGYVLLLLDVTESHRVQARRLEERVKQATVEEREHLALRSSRRSTS